MKIRSIEVPGSLKLENLGTVNLIIGKNGSGKSSLLKNIDQAISSAKSGGISKYITPERGGLLKYDPNVESVSSSDPNWMQDTRRNNQFYQFRQQTMVLYRRLEILVLREIANDRTTKADFNQTLIQINGLLDNIRIEPHGSDFRIVAKNGASAIPAEAISSGESELIALAIECLTFARECKSREVGWLLIDEPDVHLHPDLQARLAKLLVELTKDEKICIIIATHSTALVSALSSYSSTHLYFLRPKPVSPLQFRAATDALKRIVPVFGAHPLSNIFNERRLLILEGEDDVRIWQRAVRSAQGKIKIYPVEAGTITEMNSHEVEAAEVLASVYDNACAYSLRDRDEAPAADLNSIGPVLRFRLRCRNAENLLLTDDVLLGLKVDWPTLKTRIDGWIAAKLSHPHHATMVAFQAGSYDRKNFDLKEVRNDILALVGTNKSWEDAVGIGIAKMTIVGAAPPNSLQDFLGDGVCAHLLKD